MTALKLLLINLNILEEKLPIYYLSWFYETKAILLIISYYVWPQNIYII